MEKNVSKNYDSSSSADTDEIIERCKKKKGLALSSKPVTELPLKRNIVLNNTKNHPHRIMPELGINVKPSLLDRSLELSEYTAGISEYSNQPLSGENPGKLEMSDSYDSDLDSNDFKLVAKKLAQIATSSRAVGQKGLGNKRKEGHAFGRSQDNSHATSQNKNDAQALMTNDEQTVAHGVAIKSKSTSKSSLKSSIVVTGSRQ
uniref:Uncharacterized protein n=1 Tax=Arion vulgaris TaxID=1028688 RepID=A0A0B7ACC6_9EUPU